MLSPHTLVRLLCVFAIAIGLAAAAPLTGASAAVELLYDGGFEETAPGPGVATNPWWEGFDSEYWQGPLCRPDNSCDDGFGVGVPRSGLGYVWLGAGGLPNQSGWVRQQVTIPAGHTATLRYWYRFRLPSDLGPYDITLTVSIDGQAVATQQEPGFDQPDYVEDVVDVSAYADGGPHLLEFAYVKPSVSVPAVTSLLIDDVSLEAVDLPPQTSLTTPDLPPQTSLTMPNLRDGRARSLTVPAEFSASESGPTFICSLDSAPYSSCTSPAQLTVKPGPHVFRVVARDTAGNADATPAEVAFTAYDCPTLKSEVVKHGKKLRGLKKRLVAARAALRVAKETHDREVVDRLQAKVHRIEKKRKVERKELRGARAAYAPCLYA